MSSLRADNTTQTKLEQLEHLRSEDTPRRLKITHTIESKSKVTKFEKFAKFGVGGVGWGVIIKQSWPMHMSYQPHWLSLWSWVNSLCPQQLSTPLVADTAYRKCDKHHLHQHSITSQPPDHRLWSQATLCIICQYYWIISIPSLSPLKAWVLPNKHSAMGHKIRIQLAYLKTFWSYSCLFTDAYIPFNKPFLLSKRWPPHPPIFLLACGGHVISVTSTNHCPGCCFTHVSRAL